MDVAVVEIVLGKLAEVLTQQLTQEVRLVISVKDEIQQLESSFAPIQAVLADAERREVKDEVVRIWLEKLKVISCKIGDVLDEWSTELLKIKIKHDDAKICSNPFRSPCFCFQRASHRRDIALQIKKLNEKLGAIVREKDAYGLIPNVAAHHQDLHHHRELTTSIIDESTVFGRGEEIKDVVNKLMVCPQESSSSSTLQIISIVGTGGMGKTTLAQRAYNEPTIKSHFEKMIWICVSDPFDRSKVISTIFEKLDGDSSKTTQQETQMDHITRSIKGKKFMLVLDDVWTEDSKDFQPLLNALQSASNGSKILVTTRKEQVARSIGSTDMHTIGKLSDGVSWDLFSSIAFVGKTEEYRKNMEEHGKKIVERCKGLPLALKTIAVHLRYKTTGNQWREVLDSEVWKLQVAEKEIFPPLMLSYYDLPSIIKRCFSYCAILPKDLEIQPIALIRLWMAQGYLNSSSGKELEVVGQDYLEELAMRSFFQDFEWDEVDGSIKSFKMHDIVHDFAQFLAKRECKTVDIGKEGSPTIITSSSSSEKLRHLRISNAKRSKDVTGILDLRNLHTLILRGVPKGFDSGNLFRRMRFVKVLDLSEGSITAIPKEVGALKHLRYLDLSGNKFKTLPEEICELCNLQTMRLEECYYLEELPKGMGKLVNLRHLLIDESNWKLGPPFPQGIKRNTSLRTLPPFIVGRSEDANVAHIEDLSRLNHLEGALTIRGLENVRDRSDAANAELKNKTKLVDLTLDFQWRHSNWVIDRHLDVAEGLEPHSALEKLKIRFYNATALPSWIMELSKLRRLVLDFCFRLKELPPLGRLVSLESLAIYVESDLKTISGDFWGIPKPRTENDSSVSAEEEGSTSATTMLITSSSSSELAVFPKLEELILYSWHNLEEWEGPPVVTRKITNNPTEEDSCIILPRLRQLRIIDCGRLKELPDCLITAPLLQELDLSRSPLLQARYDAHPKFKKEISLD